MDVPNGDSLRKDNITETKKQKYIRISKYLILNGIFLAIFIVATVRYVNEGIYKFVFIL